MKYLKLMRVHHWIKNGLVMAPLFLSGTLFHSSRLWDTVLGTIAFCLISSAVYIINDMHDIAQDKLHSTKCKRPLPSGEITITRAKVLLAALFIVSFSLNFIAGDIGTAFAGAAILFIYFIINILYSTFGLKNVPLLDIIILVIGYLLRLQYGSIISAVWVSSWLYLFVIAGSFYLVFGKRRNELTKENGETRRVLKGYTKEFLDKNMYSCMTLSLAFYSLWCLEKGNSLDLSVNYYLWTVPLVIVIWMKYSMDIEGDWDGDPMKVLLGDKLLMGLAVVYLAIMAVMIYRK